jgi:hypothetical protein
MKQASFKIICLVIWACVTVFYGFGDDVTNSFETRVLESFNGGDDAPYIWKAQSSRYVTPVRNANGEVVQDSSGNTVYYPITTYVAAWPAAAFGYNRSSDDPPLRSLGINGGFDRKGYNWVDLYPVLADDPDGNPYEIQIPGRVHNLDMWVWGSNLRYYIEIFLRDYRGVVHSLRLGDIAYIGWRNLRVNVPSGITQARKTLPSYAGLSFVKFRIWTQPTEKVDNFYIYFKQLKVLTDMFEGLFDGNDLADPTNVERLWSNN